MFKSLVCALLFSVIPLAAMADGPPRTAEVADNDARAVRAVVEAQLKAFAADDAVKAFSHASPAIQKQFGDAATFAEMVRRTYPMLIRPASISFYRPLAIESVVVQGVMFRDGEGHVWRADYQLQRQPDKRWRIEGCQVVPGNDTSTT